MPPTAVLFPGQGSHAEGMEEPWRDSPRLRRGIELLGENPFEQLDEGTRLQQPALLLCGVAAWDAAALEEPPVGAAGHSLGEYAALVAADALDFDAAVELVAVRGRAMARAGELAPGGMVAFLGGDEDGVRALADELELTVANDNAPGQLVLSGRRVAIDAATARADGLRARARELPVSGAFHSPLMEPAAEDLRAALARVEFRAPRFPVISNGTAAPFGDDIAAELAANLLRGVRWREALLALDALGAEEFVEAGPGRVLSGLVRRTLGRR